jgi:hypothetical protein
MLFAGSTSVWVKTPFSALGLSEQRSAIQFPEQIRIFIIRIVRTLKFGDLETAYALLEGLEEYMDLSKSSGSYKALLRQ